MGGYNTWHVPQPPPPSCCCGLVGEVVPPPSPHPHPPSAHLHRGRKKEHWTDAPQEVGWPLGSDLVPGIELEKHIFSPDQTSYFISIFRWLLSLRTLLEESRTSPPKTTSTPKSAWFLPIILCFKGTKVSAGMYEV